MRVPGRPAPVYLFVLWSEARGQQERILDDLRGSFGLLDLVEITWSTDHRFALSLSRMYGDNLPPGSEKEIHCGTGPFLAVVVQDPRPQYRIRRTKRGLHLLNTSVVDARRRYRDWTGGGYRVHVSESVAEADRNLVLLLGERVSAFLGRTPPLDGPRPHPYDPVGTTGWESVAQLADALAPYGARVLPAGADADRLVVVGTDAWWAERIAAGRVVGEGVRAVAVAGRTREVTFSDVHRGRLGRAVDRASARLLLP